MAWTISKPLSFQVTCKSCMADIGFYKEEVAPSLNGKTAFIVCPECGKRINVATITSEGTYFTSNVSPLDQGV